MVMFPSYLLLLAAFSHLATASAIRASRQSAQTACGAISDFVSSFLFQNPGDSPNISAAVAFECLQSVPNFPEPAQKLIATLKPFVEWQSDLAWLKDPPASYTLPSIDVLGNLDKIADNAAAGGYISEYDFQQDIFLTIVAAHDGHFNYMPDVFRAFIFRNDLVSDLISVSTDGKQLPKLYHSSSFTADATSDPVAITAINGVDAATLVSDIAMRQTIFQDQDSQWNSLFLNYANVNAVLPLAASYLFQGPNVTLAYENGNVTTSNSYAQLSPNVDFTGITSGNDFYLRFCNLEPPTTKPNPTQPPRPSKSVIPRTTPTPPAPTISGFPKPIVRDNIGDVTSGYFLGDSGYEDVAVLSLLGFVPPNVEDALNWFPDFQATIKSFLAQSKEAGKQRLVIDLTGNGGGVIAAGFELFTQLFPDAEQFHATNIRRTDSLVSVAGIADSAVDFVPSTDAEKAARDALFLGIGSIFSPSETLGPAGGSFSSREAIIAPVTLQSDTFTAYQKQSWLTPDSPFPLTRDAPPAVFKPENVVLLTDGQCGSTCTIFSYLMLFQLNIKTVSVGGRPQAAPMQSIAGVEGAQLLPFEGLAQFAESAITLAPEDQQEELRAGSLGTLAAAYPISRAANPASPGGLNSRNQFSPEDSKTPLQFLYEPANCRFFYTVDMLYDPERVWKYAVDATWTDPEKFCVENSIVANDATRALDPAFAKPSDTPTTGPGEDQPGENQLGSSDKPGANGGLDSSATRGQIGIALLFALVTGTIMGT